MSAKTDFDYLRDMLTYAEDGHALIENRSEADLESDASLRYAVQYCILIVGEAASHVSTEMRGKTPQIPWQQIVGMRNWLVHGYVRINSKIVWETATLNLPRLMDEILQVLPPEQT
jgi:uncharacterized protein with HEPN domain